MFIQEEDNFQMMSSCWQITFAAPLGDPGALTDFMENWFEVSEENYLEDGRIEYVGFISGQFDEQAMKAAAGEYSLELPAYHASLLESSNWLKDYVIKFAPFEVEDFMIYGIHESTAPQTAKIPLQIYAATAFGSDHQTTRSCLKAISNLYHQGFVPAKILDVGTGSGILSLASAKLWPTSTITAVDIDEEATLVTESNAQTNQITNITIAVSDGYHSPLVKNNAPFDLILANILARPLLEMAADLAQSLAPEGFAVLSGFVDDQADWIISAHQQLGLRLVKLYELDNWRAALLQKEN